MRAFSLYCNDLQIYGATFQNISGNQSGPNAQIEGQQRSGNFWCVGPSGCKIGGYEKMALELVTVDYFLPGNSF